MLRFRPRILIAAGLALSASLAAVTPFAGAAEYSVNVCRHADGSIAPTDGWQLAIADDAAIADEARNSCPLGGQVDLALGAGPPHGQGAGPVAQARVSFSASPPAGAGWTRMQVWWAYRSNPVTAAEDPAHLVAGTVGTSPLGCSWGRGTGACGARGQFAGPPLSDANLTTVPVAAEAATSPMAVAVICDSSPLACPANASDPLAQLRAWRMLVTLSDANAPAFAAQPSLPPTVSLGTPVAFSVTDAGSGVYTAQLLVDGTPAGAPAVLDRADGRCAPRADGTFDHLAPCPSQVAGATLALDTRALPDGRHTVGVRVADAAGNVADSAQVATTVDNPVPLAAIPLQNPLRGRGHTHNGSGLAGAGKLDAGLRRGTRGSLAAKARVLPGGRVRVAGRLTGSDGKAVGRAVLVLRLAQPGSSPRFLTFATSSNGTFSRVLRWGKTKHLSVQWYPWGDSTAPVSSRSLRFIGAARIAMRVTPRSPRNGQALRFAGTVRGAPAGGRVTIQVLTGRFWRTFLTPRVDSRGRFAGRRLLVRSGGLSYCLRARILSQPGFGYSAGFTKPVCRRVRR